MHDSHTLEERKDFKKVQFFLHRRWNCKPNQFESVHENNLPIVEVFVCLNFSIVEIDIVDGKLIGELIRWSLQNYRKTVCLLRYNIQKSHVTVIDAVFRRSVERCFFNKTTKLLHPLTGGNKRVRDV